MFIVRALLFQPEAFPSPVPFYVTFLLRCAPLLQPGPRTPSNTTTLVCRSSFPQRCWSQRPLQTRQNHRFPRSCFYLSRRCSRHYPSHPPAPRLCQLKLILRAAAPPRSLRSHPSHCLCRSSLLGRASLLQRGAESHHEYCPFHRLSLGSASRLHLRAQTPAAILVFGSISLQVVHRCSMMRSCGVHRQPAFLPVAYSSRIADAATALHSHQQQRLLRCCFYFAHRCSSEEPHPPAPRLCPYCSSSARRCYSQNPSHPAPRSSLQVLFCLTPAAPLQRARRTPPRTTAFVPVACRSRADASANTLDSC